MRCLTFEHQKQRTPYVYPPGEGIWVPLYVLLDGNGGTEGHTHEYVELGIVYYGHARHTRIRPETGRRQTGRLAPGDVFGIPPGEYHEVAKIGKEWQQMVVLFDPSMLGADWDRLLEMPGINALLKKHRTLHLSPAGFDEITAVTTHLQQELFHRAANYEINLRGLLLDLLIRIGRCPVHAENAVTNVHTEKAVQFIRRHLAEKITLEEIARESGAGKTHLCHLFREKMGMGLWDYLTQMRVERAKFYLRTSDRMQIGEIASMCGFEDNSYFSKVFRKTEGCSPRKYLQSFRQQQADAMLDAQNAEQRRHDPK